MKYIDQLVSKYHTEKNTKIVVIEDWVYDKEKVLSQNHFMPIVDKNNTSLLSHSCSQLQKEWVIFCLTHNASWSPNIYGDNPLHALFKIEESLNSLTEILEILQLLSEKKERFQNNIRKKNRDKQTPIMIAFNKIVLKSNFEIFRYEDENSSAIFKIFETLLINGASPNEIIMYQDTGLTILNSLIKNISDTTVANTTKFIELLLKYGVDTYQKDPEQDNEEKSKAPLDYLNTLCQNLNLDTDYGKKIEKIRQMIKDTQKTHA